MPSGPQSSRSASPSRSVSSHAAPINAVNHPLSDTDGNNSSDGQLDQDMPAQLSLNHLKQGESHQRIRHGATQLLRLTEKFPGYNGSGLEGGYESVNDQALPSDNDIRAMTRLSHGIARDISQIRALRREDPSYHKRRVSELLHAMGPPSVSRTRVAPDCGSTTGRGKNHRQVEFSCHKCHRVDTPEWRPGPDGPSTLCNVCGLVYAKRERKKEESTMPTFGSPSFS